MDTGTRDQLIADARSLPELVARARRVDPPLAESLTGKALIASKSVWGNILAPIVTYGVARYGLGWDSEMCNIVTGGAIVVGTVVFRLVTRSPIVGIVRARVKTDDADRATGIGGFAVAALAGIACVAVTACSPDQQQRSAAALNVAENAVDSAINQWRIAKGVAEVAVKADPRLAPAVNAAVAKVDPILAKAEAAAPLASADARALLALAAQISAQAAEVMAVAAPAVRVVPAS